MDKCVEAALTITINKSLIISVKSIGSAYKLLDIGIYPKEKKDFFFFLFSSFDY